MFNNWALFGSAQQETSIPQWTFGPVTDTIESLTLGFLKGIHNFGKELFNKGIASFTLSPSKSNMTTGFWGDELFIVNLEGSFFLVISDPRTTIKMIHQIKDTIPNEIGYLIKSVLVGNATVQYADMCSSLDSELIPAIDKLFQSALSEIITPERQYELNVFVERGSCSFSGLDSTEILVFHYILRQHFMYYYRKGIFSSFIDQPFCILQHKHGAPLPLIFNPPKNAVLLSAFLSLVNSYTSEALNSQLKGLVFGDSGARFTSIDIVHGNDYFMSISSPFRLFKNEEFKLMFSNLDSDLISELSVNLSSYLAKQITDDQLSNLQYQSLDILIQNIGSPKF